MSTNVDGSVRVVVPVSVWVGECVGGDGRAAVVHGTV